jgi:M6 family metalloprotease-like protein
MRNILKGLLLVTIILLNTAIEIYAVPAKPDPVKYQLPDGTKIEILLKGDEKVRWAETLDGYSILLNKDGFYEYALLNEKGDMVRSGVRAYNLSQRPNDHKSTLEGLSKKLHFSKSQISIMKQIWQIKEKEASKASKAFPTTGNRKLICILIGYSDLSFTKTQTEFDNLFNQIGYSTGGATGSVKDYYLENSYDQFNLTVDVAGPYTASNTMSYYGANDGSGWDLRPRELVTEAVYAANADVDFSDYDNDSDGEVDGVYVIYAGYGEEAGASANAIWAHAWAISTVTLDGVDISRYSCSAELRGNSGSNITNIGVICHEFGHVLSAPDFYDTDYDDDGTWMDGTGEWDMMAGGSWNNNGATPAHHNMFTKYYYYGWVTPSTLSAAASVTMNNSAENAEAYLINTSTSNEYFLIENRQQVGFDASIPGSGLIIYHVDQDGVDAHDFDNDINATHPMYMYPVAQNSSYSVPSSYTQYGTIDAATCAWDGSGKTSFTDASTPSMKSWANANTNKPITNISESSGVISFDFMGGASAAIVVSESSLDFEKVYSGYYSRPQSYTVTGSGLSSDITVTAPTGIEVTTTCGSGYGSSVILTQSGGTVNATVYARYTGGTVSGNITHASTGATTQNVSISETASSTNLPAGYYSSASGSGTTLRDNLEAIIDGHTIVGYDNLWTAFEDTDVLPNGYVWDMYSDKGGCVDNDYYYTHITDKDNGTLGSAEGDWYNREHSFPASWFGSASPTYSDLFHLYPTDKYVNNQRSNNEFGEVSTGTTYSNGSMLGNNTYTGSSGATAFEPIDEYKGDFARSYFYLATRYASSISGWTTSPMIDGDDSDSDGSVFEEWALNMLIEWHTNDPVSQKEMTRNDAIYLKQNNRNPFIDNPDYVNDIWGTSPALSVSASALSGYSYQEGSGPSASQSFDLSGTNLDGTQVTVTAPTNYEVSTDNSSFSTSANVSYTAPTLSSTAIYVRLKSGLSLADYNNENVTCDDNGTASDVTVSNSGSVTAAGGGGGTTCEDFSLLNQSSYGNYSIGEFYVYNGLCNSTNALSNNAVRLRNASGSYLELQGSDGNGVDGGIGSISFWYRNWDGSPAAVYDVSVSIDGGAYSSIGTINTSSTTYGEFTHDINSSSDNIKVKILYTSGERLHIDDFCYTSYSGGSTPTLTVSTSSLTGFTYEVGAGPSEEQSFTVEGSDLTDDIVLTAPTNYKISTGTGGSFVATSPLTLSESGGSVSTTTIYVRLKAGLSQSDYNSEDITVASTGATSETVTCSGNVSNRPDWCNLQSPANGTNTESGEFLVYAQVYEPGVTEAAGQGSGVTCWIGYNTTDTDPSTWTNWVAASFNTQSGNNDEFVADIGSALPAGTYYYASRFSVDGTNYSYGGYSAGGGHFWDGTTNVSGTLTVNTNYPDWCNLQWPDNGSIDLGDAYNVYARIFETGVTEAAGQGAGITAWIGYNTSNTNPSTWTDWVVASYNTDQGNNDEYVADLGAALAAGGTYYYASRFSVNGTDYSYGGYNAGGGNFWDGTTNVSGELTVTATGPCGSEDFVDAGNNGSYSTINWTGLNSVDWTATDARSDQDLDGDETIMLRNGSLTNDASVAGGCGTIEFDYAQIYSGGSTLKVYVNSVQYGGDITVNSTSSTHFSTVVDAAGDIDIEIENSGNRTLISNLQWSCYSGVVNDSDSEVTAGAGAEPGTIASTVDTDGEEIAVFDFTFTDAGSGDTEPTIIDQIQITQGSANGVADWTNAIAGAYLSGTDLGSDLAGTVAATTITFANDDMISIADGGNETYTLKFYLNTDLSAITDNDVLEFALDYSDISADGAGSSFGSGAPESGDANCAIDITATKLLFVQQPTNTIAGDAMSPDVTVEATDVNGNRDTDFTSNIEITSTGTLTGTPVSVAASSGLATFSSLTHTALGTGITLNAERGTTNDWDVTSNTFNITGNTNSDIVFEPMVEPTNIDYTSYQAANISGGSDDIEVAQFTIRDGGAGTDDDGSSTTLTDISFDLSNWENIRRLALYDGVTELGEEDGAATVTFSGLTIEATDDGTKTFSVRVSFNTTVTDNQQFQFVVSSATATGSTFAAADAGAAESSIDGDDNRIEVTATKLVFSQQPVNTVVDSEMSPLPEVEAQDNNDNLDLDYTETVSVTSTGTLSGAVSSAAAAGVASFSVTHTAAGTGLELTATQGAMSITSTTFSIYAAPLLIAYQGFEVDPATPVDSWAYSGGTTTETSSKAYSGTQSLRIDGTSVVTFDNFDLSDFTSIELSVAFAAQGVDSGDDLFMDISYDNGSTWEGEVKLVDGSTNGNVDFGTTSSSPVVTVGSNPYTVSIDGAATQIVVKFRTANLGSSDYYYIDEVKLTGISTLTVDEDSYVTAGAGAEPGTIASTIDTDGEEIMVFDFTFNDASSGDGFATIIDQIQITQGSANEVADWTDAIAGAYLSGTDLGVDLAGTVNATNITFGSDDMISIADGGNETYTVKVYLNTDLTGVSDNDILEFKLDYSNILTDYTGSAFGSGAVESGDGNCAIDIEATELRFIVQPRQTTFVDKTMSPSPKVKACDVNGNKDIDYSTDITMTSTGTLEGTPVTGTLSSGIATFSIKHTVIGSGLTLTASSGVLTDGTSTTFDIINHTYCSDLMISEYMEAPGQNTGIELFNGTGSTIDLSNYQLQSDHNGGGWDYAVTLSGMLAHGDVFLIVDDGGSDLIDSLTAYGVNIDLYSTNSLLLVSGNDPIGLFKNVAKAWTLLDVVGDGTNYEEVNLRRNDNIFAPTTTFDISEWTVSPNSYGDLGNMDTPLPVVWDNVSASETNGSVLVEWSTHSEINNDYFEVEHSVNNIDFNTVGIVDGAGNSSIEQSYSYLHSGAVLGHNYYRIKQIDFDGAYSYSKVVTANLSDANNSKLNIEYVFINDQKQEALIRYTKNAQVMIKILDITGKVLWSKSQIMNNEYEYINLEDFNVVDGMFLITVKDIYQHDSKKFIVR